jgi:hypothetical protein
VGNSNRGIAVEMSEYAFGAGVLIDHNVIMDNHSEMQIDVMDASGSLFVNNLIAGDKQGVIVRQVYGRDATRSDNNAFYNNIFCNNSSNIYSIPYPAARAGEHRFLGNLYDGNGRKMFINNWCDINSTSPYNESQFRSKVAADAGTTTTALNSAGAFADKVVKLNLAEWKTFWSKHTTQNDNDAEVMTGFTAEYLPATQSVRLTLPTAVAQRDNTRWDTPYRSTYGLTEDSSYPGPFDNLQAGTHEYPFYSGALPILERGQLPGPEETEELDVPYSDYEAGLVNITLASETPVTINIYPNPAVTDFTVKSTKTIFDLKLYNLQGQKLVQLYPKSLEINVPLSVYPAGLYLLQIVDESGITSKKISKN